MAIITKTADLLSQPIQPAIIQSPTLHQQSTTNQNIITIPATSAASQTSTTVPANQQIQQTKKSIKAQPNKPPAISRSIAKVPSLSPKMDSWNRLWRDILDFNPPTKGTILIF
jgi:hypothetical protein